jgi:hypothetical protein
MVGYAVQAFAPAASPSVLVPIFIFGYILPAVSGMLFPYIKRELYETAFVVKKKIVGIPLLTLAGLAAFVGLAVGTYSIFTSGVYTFNLVDYVFYGIAYGFGAVIFIAAYLIRKSQGIDISLIFKEIPPE